MQNNHIYDRRISQFIDRVALGRYSHITPMAASFTYDQNRPIPIETLDSRRWRVIKSGTAWGQLWGSAWFRFEGTVPAEFAGSSRSTESSPATGQHMAALIDLGAEGCLFVDGSPVQGLTDVPRGKPSPTGKRRIMLDPEIRAGQTINLLVEAGANTLFGAHGSTEFVFTQADLAVFHPDVWQLSLDLRFLHDLAASLPRTSVRARRILRGLNDAANLWADGRGTNAVRKIAARLLGSPAGASATTAWAVGHAHIDLAWLWPARETRRKAARTFSTALRMLEEYPDYVFGESQPQLYEWVKSDYPALYREIKGAVSSGRWECQGAMWVEPDMNVPSGESLARQLIYGKRFFREEFGKDVKNLWLPDVFGYSASLPQLLHLSGVTTFMTQKISWNETNVFPHHTFDWEGIDGTRIRTHFLPANTYNARNTPEELIQTESRFAQADVSNDWLQLYGVGDGGGGPSRTHIEYARRAGNTEGLPRVRLATAAECFTRINRIPAADLPVWRGELYLERHRGTYTTHARMKALNRRLEQAAHDAEFFAVVSGLDQRTQMGEIWKDVLLNQFHDILPGSSIGQVYIDAEAQSERNLIKLERLQEQSLAQICGTARGRATKFAVWNTQSWERSEVICLPVPQPGPRDVPSPRSIRATDSDGCDLPAQLTPNGLLVQVDLPPMGCATISLSSGSAADGARSPVVAESAEATTVAVTGDRAVLENDRLRVQLGTSGTIVSIREKHLSREMLTGEANTLLLWEDLPYSWDAWDISHYYRETEPEQAVLRERSIIENGPVRAALAQVFSIGRSSISQTISLNAGSGVVRIENSVQWNERSKQLRVQAAPAVHSDRATYEIQFGCVSRPAHANTSWDAAQFEVAGQRFADLSQSDAGFGLINDSKYGHYIRDGLMELTLLRSPQDPDPSADAGHHEFVFAYYPHAGSWEQSDLLERAHDLNSPPVVCRLPASATIGTHSEFGLTDGTVKIDTAKQTEDGTGTILRLYETRGQTETAVVRFRQHISVVEVVNLLEEKLKLVRLKKSTDPDFQSEVSLEFGPYQVQTVKVMR